MTTPNIPNVDISKYPDPNTGTLLPLLALSLSLTVAGKVADNLWLTWSQVCEAFQNAAQHIGNTKDCLLCVFAHFSQDYKLQSQITDLFAIVLDFDHQTNEQFNNCIQLAQRLSTRGIVHTTWSDDPTTHPQDQTPNLRNNRCFRIIIPLDQPVPVTQWADTWQTFYMAFATMAGATPDGQCKNPNRRYYVPSTKAEPFIGHDQVTMTVPTLICWGE